MALQILPLLFGAVTPDAKVNIVVLVLIQTGLIIALSRAIGLLFRAMRQPLVMGEIVAGIMLGPSLFGVLAPGLFQQVFPQETAPYMNILAQVGLIFFMFLVGLELNRKILRGKGHAAILVSHSSIILPFALGVLLAFYLYGTVSNTDVPFTSFALFMGAAMSITAFPVLARIVKEQNLQKTSLGAIAITCAAVDDVTAWCILAFVISIVRSGGVSSAVITTLLALAYIAFMFTIGRALFNRIADHAEKKNQGQLTQSLVAAIFIGVICSSIITEMIGVHTLFGAFIFGVVMPDRNLLRKLIARIEDFTSIFLLPIFFAYTGLRTNFNLLIAPEMLVACLLVILAATLGKFGGATAAARISGLGARDASALGLLMNTRGLMELIILNIGLDLKVVSPTLFAIMVIMALVTTFATSPILRLIYPRGFLIESEVDDPAAEPPAAEPLAATAREALVLPAQMASTSSESS
ncbi:MAG TPA: cation:proton antiporter [Pyrinomonadaceae bacterium]|jgi:Kef-type K+ transport system membrane component KefB